jgi:hypothetical protein
MKKLLINSLLMSLVSFYISVFAMQTSKEENLPRIYVNNEEITFNLENEQVFKTILENNNFEIYVEVKPNLISLYKLDKKIYFLYKITSKEINLFDQNTLAIFITTYIDAEDLFKSTLNVKILTKQMVEQQLGKDAASHFSSLPKEIREEVYKFYKLIQLHKSTEFNLPTELKSPEIIKFLIEKQ